MKTIDSRGSWAFLGDDTEIPAMGLPRKNKDERTVKRRAGNLKVNWPIKAAAVIRTARADNHRGPEGISIINADYICSD